MPLSVSVGDALELLISDVVVGIGVWSVSVDSFLTSYSGVWSVDLDGGSAEEGNGGEDEFH